MWQSWRSVFATLSSLCLLITSAAQAAPPIPAAPRDYRAAWCATVSNIDWPVSAGATPSIVTAQKARLIAHLDALVDANMNAMYFQVRPACDAMYISSIEPPSEWFTGSQTTAATWDPLAYAVTEGHKRGIEVHAWVNPYRAAVDQNTSTKASNHVMKAHPDWCVAYAGDGRTYLDPGKPEVIAYIKSVISDIVTRYDVDGVVFDDYFYPGTDFNDTATYQAYVDTGGAMTLDNWRRDNVNQLIHGCYTMIHGIRQSCQFEVGPFGIWRPGYPTGITGADYYATHYCDTRLWLQNGWVDSLSPQLYWTLASTGQPFGKLIDWWVQQNPARHVMASTADYRVGTAAWPGSTNAEIVNQVNRTYQAGGVGTVHYSIKFLTDDTNSQRTALKAGPYAKDALRPASTWLDNVPPPMPIAAMSDPAGSPSMRTITFSQHSGDEAATWWCVYTYDGTAWTLKVLPGVTTSLQVDPGTQAFAVSAVDRVGNESARAGVTPPNAASGLTAIASGVTVNLSWTDNSNDETGFAVYRATTAGGPYTLVTTTAANTTSYTDTPGPVGTYYYIVRSVIGLVEAADSNEASATIVPPPAPSGLTAPVNGMTATLHWTDNSTNETGFEVYRSTTSGGSYTLVTTTAANATSYTDTPGPIGTYYYVVRAMVGLAASAYSNEASATLVPPAAPSGLTATPSGVAVNLGWTDNSSYETSFEVYRSTTSGGSYALIYTTASNATSYTDTPSGAGTYYYVVKAVAGVAASGYSNEASASIVAPAAPTWLSGAINGTDVNLTWTDNSNDETAFQVLRSTAAGGPYTVVQTTAANATSATDSPTASGTYYYVVRGVKSTLYSDNSNEVSITVTLPTSITTIFSEDFEAYSTKTDMLKTNGGKWDTSAFGTISTTKAHGGTKSLYSIYTDTGSATASWQTSRGGLQATDDAPITVTYWLYDSNAPSGSGRRGLSLGSYTGGTWGNGTYNNFVCLGLYNPTNSGRYNHRVVFGGTGWVAGTIARTVGWHELKMVLKSSTMEVYVDGVANYTTPQTFSKPPDNLKPDNGWNCLRLNNYAAAADPSGANFYFDDINVTADVSVPVTLSGVWID